MSHGKPMSLWQIKDIGLLMFESKCFVRMTPAERRCQRGDGDCRFEAGDGR